MQDSLLLRVLVRQKKSTYNLLIHLCKSRLMLWAPVERYFVLCQLLDGLCNLWQSGRKFLQVVDHPNKGLYLLLIGRDRHLGNGCDFVFIWLVTACSVCFTEKVYFLLLILQLFIVPLHITFLSTFKQGCQCLIIVTVSLWLGFLPTIIMSSTITITFFSCPKHWSSLCWNTSPATVAPKGIMVYLNLPNSV